MDTSRARLSLISGFSRRQVLLQSTIAASGLVAGLPRALAAPDDSISRTAEAIHQEVVFNSKPSRIYEALTDASQFQKVQALSAAMRGADLTAHPAVLSRESGSAFALFGGYITGRQIELVANQRIVQAWRVGGWAPGIYSIARFELAEAPASTRLVFDHTGFPVGAADHLAEGWKANYWEPLKKYLG